MDNEKYINEVICKLKEEVDKLPFWFTASNKISAYQSLLLIESQIIKLKAEIKP